MKQVTAYEAFGIYADYDGNVPDTMTVCLVATEELAKELCGKLNEDPRSYMIVYAENFEHFKKFKCRRELTDKLDKVYHSVEDALKGYDCWFFKQTEIVP